MRKTAMFSLTFILMFTIKLRVSAIKLMKIYFTFHTLVFSYPYCFAKCVFVVFFFLQNKSWSGMQTTINPRRIRRFDLQKTIIVTDSWFVTCQNTNYFSGIFLNHLNTKKIILYFRQIFKDIQTNWSEH